ncbi:MAG TPA: ABC transporter substrate-binding protein [Candidatus Binatus sp.]|nr:ABC transporter substrate-binding protein [Candidatus Binatus sp.]
MAKNHIWLLVFYSLASIVPADAQQLTKLPRIGYVSGRGDASTPDPQFEAFGKGMRDLGYIDGKNIVIEYRYGGGQLDRMPSLVAELVQSKVDILVSGNLPSIRAAKETTSTVPVVMVLSVDPVATAIVDSLARPGGNITGLTRLTRELSGKRLELLKEVFPRLSRVGVLWDGNAPGPAIAFKEYSAAARSLKIPLQSLEVRGPNPDLDAAFHVATKERVNALVTILNPVLSRYQKPITELAIKNRLPSIYEATEYVEAGGLMSYATNEADSFRRAAYYVDRILKGTKPADLPVEQPTKFELVFNLKTAKQIGVTIPPNVLARADRVIR